MTEAEYSRTKEQYLRAITAFGDGNIHKLLAALDTAFWERVSASGEDIPTAYRNRATDVFPKGSKEIAIWEELTSPHNYDELKEYVIAFAPLLDDSERSDYGRMLYNALLAKAGQRAAGGS